MREYFESEMRLLHEAAADFAKAHPEQARMLNLAEVRDRDPYVERLLEGMAFIAVLMTAKPLSVSNCWSSCAPASYAAMPAAR